MSQVMMSGLIVGIIAMLFWTPFLMARGVSKLDDRSGAADFILCMIPVINIARAEKMYYGKFGVCTISPVMFVIGVAVRFFLWKNAYSNPMVGTISILVFWAVLLFYVLSNMIFVYTIIHDADAVTGFKLVLLTVAYPFGQYYVGTYLSNVIRHMKETAEAIPR